MQNGNKTLANNLFKTTLKKSWHCVQNEKYIGFVEQLHGFIFSYACKIMPHMEGQWSQVINIQKYYRWFMVSRLPHTLLQTPSFTDYYPSQCRWK